MGEHLVTLTVSHAVTEERVLELVRRLEAPGGYDTVYSGVTVRPPRVLTTMSVEEVLAWQRSTVRQGSVSSAAGGYQIIRPTLQRLVDQGVVSLSETFDTATQDRLGRHLLRETGYRDGDTSVATANRIAGVWAALPQVGGAGAGRSVYHGVAGNHALIDADTWMGVLAGTADMGDVQATAAVIRAGQQFGFAWDRFLDDLGRASTQVMRSVAGLAINLLLGLCLIDFVLRAGHWILSGDLAGSMGGLAMRLLTICLCLAVLLIPDALLGAADATARRLAGEVGSGGDFAIAGFTAGRTALAFSLLEGLFNHPRPIQILLQIIALLLAITMAIQIALILYWTLNLTLTGAAGLFAMGFGGLKETRTIPVNYVRHLIGAGLALLCVLMILSTTTNLAWSIRAEGSITAAALSILLLECVACALIWVLPKSVAGVVRK
ncbi:hypothetical protein [Ruegeria sp.]|uniref:hypothetical protein n=1 Tax=Ruegeria sp. TaxID=1879320 RepID=UPI003B00582B